MANIKSSKKRIKIAAKKTLQNKMIKSRTKTIVKKLVSAIKTNDKALASAELKNSIKAIDMACTKGIYHKKNASRQKSRLTKAVNKIA